LNAHARLAGWRGLLVLWSISLCSFLLSLSGIMLDLVGWSKVLQHQLRAVGLSIPQDNQGRIIVDLHKIYDLIPRFPEIALPSLREVATASLAGGYDMIANDFEAVTQLLSDLEDDFELDPEIDHATEFVQSISNERKPFRWDRQSTTPKPIVIPSTHPSAPTIIITPSGPQNPDRVPCQDREFGSKLTVPHHPCFNEVHPPMLPPKDILPFLDGWTWKNGHWAVVLPSLPEQARRGLFSRPQMPRKRLPRISRLVSLKSRNS